MEVGGPDQVVEGLVGLVGQEICLHLEWHLENGPDLCY